MDRKKEVLMALRYRILRIALHNDHRRTLLEEWISLAVPLVGQGTIQGIGIGASPSSTQAAAAGAESTPAAEQMAYEDAWKASNTDFRTPFASIEDAITRYFDLDPPPPKTPGIRAPFSSIEDGITRCVDVNPPPPLGGSCV
ncbi:hypothetical protein QYE76_062743 [Lolium multiflorum]|uniref:Uncharacterized protein n=1 Tax=Lolium multiflorum TaxID=4521 RepID=A0AAD8S516_LOLMU|nr:hypothetical protein QYE76_062743 [Lolium multiflorum]